MLSPIIFLCFLSLSLSILHRQRKDIFTRHKCFVTSHRGINRELPQNTMVSFERVLLYDTDGIETDVWVSKDGVPVIVHGAKGGELSGYYDHSGIVTDFTWAELSTFRTIEGNQKMPRLDEFLDFIKGKTFVNLELKDGRVDIVFPIVTKMIEERNLQEQLIVSSGKYEYMAAVEKYNQEHPDKKLTFVSGVGNGKGKDLPEDRYNKPGHVLQIYYKDLTKDMVEKAHKNGMAVFAWFEMWDEETSQIYKDLIDMGVDDLLSNTSLFAKKFRDSYLSE